MCCNSSTSCFDATCFDATCIKPTTFHTRRSADNPSGRASVDFSAASGTGRLERATQAQRS
ncbi:hypothetical protein SGCOL_008353 [Colletotrichum sp. CLE4]